MQIRCLRVPKIFTGLKSIFYEANAAACRCLTDPVRFHWYFLPGCAMSPPIKLLTSFIALGIMIKSLNNKDESDTGNAVTQAARVASTLWPIAFAAVVGPMLRAIALYKAEKGTSLGVQST